MTLYQVILAKFDGSDDNLYTEVYPPTEDEKVERIRFGEIVEAEMEEARDEADHPDSLEPNKCHNYFGLTYYRNGAAQVIQVIFKEFNEH